MQYFIVIIHVVLPVTNLYISLVISISSSFRCEDYLEIFVATVYGETLTSSGYLWVVLSPAPRVSCSTTSYSSAHTNPFRVNIKRIQNTAYSGNVSKAVCQSAKPYCLFQSFIPSSSCYGLYDL